ncbi:MAG: tRNA (guanosine(46)-N7)-methyltransferase TrmB [Erysipelotrichales bacterium]|nr:tRNA (guanosine(46)-N7)-methyltransferase TrmB [Erysipelotrichales bacterium]
MRLRNVKNAKNIVESSQYVINNPYELKGKFNVLFEDDAPIHIEIGMGKGDFIVGNAMKYQNINFIGIEKYESVMVRAIEKLNGIELPNLKLIRMDAIDIDQIFDHEIETLYLNFSDPWPKNKHEKRRLTSPIFLDKYNAIFKNAPHIVQKTDNVGLFAYSLSSLSKFGYTLERVSLDLENEDIPNIETEYEKKFKSLGVKINYLDAVKYQEK